MLLINLLCGIHHWTPFEFNYEVSLLGGTLDSAWLDDIIAERRDHTALDNDVHSTVTQNMEISEADSDEIM
jgi:hypothetical protein